MIHSLIRLDPEPAAYRYMWSVLMLPHIQATVHKNWKGPEGYHALCRLLDEGHWFAVPVIGGEAAGLVWGEVCSHNELEGHLAFLRGIAPRALQEVMEDICEFCATDFNLIRVGKEGLSRAARMFIKRAGFKGQGAFYTRELGNDKLGQGTKKIERSCSSA